MVVARVFIVQRIQPQSHSTGINEIYSCLLLKLDSFVSLARKILHCHPTKQSVAEKVTSYL
jgi:hypothetical protein